MCVCMCVGVGEGGGVSVLPGGLEETVSAISLHERKAAWRVLVSVIRSDVLMCLCVCVCMGWRVGGGVSVSPGGLEETVTAISFHERTTAWRVLVSVIASYELMCVCMCMCVCVYKRRCMHSHTHTHTHTHILL